MKTMKLRASADDLDLAVAIMEPQTAPKGIVQLVHGMCEHKERYYGFMEFLAGNGYVAVIHDHRGHGESVKSAEDLGYMYKGGWEALVEDIRIVGDMARAAYPGLPFTLFGHSMGSLAVRSYVKRYDDTVDRLFVCGCPSDNPASGAGRMLADLIGFFRGDRYRPELLRKLSFGAYNKGLEGEGYSSAWVCSDKAVLEAYHHDPLCQFNFTANGYSNLMGLMKDCYGRKGWKMARKGLPIRFISGAEDPCRISDAKLEQCAQMMRGLGYTDVSLKLYPGMRHEILNETGRAEVWNDVLAGLA